MNDVQEVAHEVDAILEDFADSQDVEGLLSELSDYIQQKRLEFVEPQGDCV